MLQALIVSTVVLWLLVLVLAVVVYALMRQIGVLHERVFPAGALTTLRGPAVGEPIGARQLVAWSGAAITLGDPAAPGSTLVLFVAPRCPICSTLLPYLHSVCRAEAGGEPLQLLLVSDGDAQAQAEFIRRHGIDPDRYVLSARLGAEFMVDKLPYALLVDERGVLRAKGLVNSREHLESLFEAKRRGVATLQELFAREGDKYEAA